MSNGTFKPDKNTDLNYIVIYIDIDCYDMIKGKILKMLKVKEYFICFLSAFFT